MFVAKEKAKTNIGEYLIYMFQVEDLIRACSFNLETIEQDIVNQYSGDKNTKKEIFNWYAGLSDLMIEENLKERGHLSFIENKINELFDFHLYLITKSDQIDYKEKAQEISEIVNDLKMKHNKSVNDIKAVLNLIYGVYLLKLRKQEISEQTLMSAKKVSSLLELLSEKYRSYELGKLTIE